MSENKQFISNQAEIDSAKVLPGFTDYIKALIEKKESLSDELKSVNDQINFMQSTCPHSWEHVTTTPHYELHKCKHCFRTINI